jgi:hypothetical protein
MLLERESRRKQVLHHGSSGSSHTCARSLENR